MNRTEYKAKLILLARSLVIHSPITAQRLNDHLRYELGYPVDSHPGNWKYYLNLAGQYHAADELIRVVSLDTNEMIPFTRESLSNHRITRLTYALKQTEYTKLITRLPNQIALINGILRPINIDAVMHLPEGTILDADPQFMESQEVSILLDLQEWINSYLMRRTVRAYMKNEEYFPAARLAVMYANIPLELENIRLSYTHTHEVHSYYVRAHLAAEGGLDVFLDDLSWDQALWLYRNIKKIRSNLGFQGNLDYLVKHLLEVKQLPLHRHILKQSDPNIAAADISVGDISTLYNMIKSLPSTTPINPLLSADKLDLLWEHHGNETFTQENQRYVIAAKLYEKQRQYIAYLDTNAGGELIGTATLDRQCMTRTDMTRAHTHDVDKALLQGRYRHWPERLDEAIDQASYNGNVLTWTRLLISDLVDTSVEGAELIYDYAIRHWLAYTFSNRIDGALTLRPPRHKKAVELSQEQAALVYLYASAKANGQDIRTIGEHVIASVRRAYVPKANTFMVCVDPKLVDEAALNVFLRGGVELPKKMDRKSFTRFITLSYLQHVKQRFFISNLDDGDTRAQLQDVMNQQYINIRVLNGVVFEPAKTDLGRTDLYGIDVTDYDADDYTLLAKRILERAIDIDENDRLVDTGRSHKAVVGILDRLTSYQTNISLGGTITRRVCMEGIAPRIMQSIALDNSSVPDNQMIAATMPETMKGRTSIKYVSPYTLEARLTYMEDHMVGHVDAGIQNMTQSFDNGGLLIGDKA